MLRPLALIPTECPKQIAPTQAQAYHGFAARGTRTPLERRPKRGIAELRAEAGASARGKGALQDVALGNNEPPAAERSHGG